MEPQEPKKKTTNQERARLKAEWIEDPRRSEIVERDLFSCEAYRIAVVVNG